MTGVGSVVRPNAGEREAIDGSALRAALARIPTSIVLAATMLEGRPVGMVIGTFTSISIDPPLVGFFGDHRSTTVDLLLRGDEIAFSVLDDTADDVCDAFRRSRQERFSSISWRPDHRGQPVPHAAIMTVNAETLSVSEVGDHRAVVSRVLDFRVGASRARPLIYFNRRLNRLRPDLSPPAVLWQLGWEH